MSSQGQNFLPMNPSQRNRPTPEVIARGHVSVPQSHHRLSPCDVTAETMPCPMTSALETKIPSCECHSRDTSHPDDVMSGTKRPLVTSSPPGKCFLPEKMSLSMMLSLQSHLPGTHRRGKVLPTVSSLYVRPFHNTVTGTLPPSCDAISREGALPYDMIRGTVPLPMMSSPGMIVRFCDLTSGLCLSWGDALRHLHARS